MEGLPPLWTTDADCVLRDPHGSCVVHNIMLPLLPPVSQVSPATPSCVEHLLGTCLVQPVPQSTPQIFGFAVFVTALTLLSVVFTVSDIRFKFRITVAPIPLIPISVSLTALIGLVVLYSDVAFSLRWPMPAALANWVLWQASAGLMFFILVFVWMYFGLVRPPVFGRSNAFHFTRQLYRIILNGDEVELRIIAHELGRSAKNIIRICPNGVPRRRSHLASPQPATARASTSQFVHRLRHTIFTYGEAALLSIGRLMPLWKSSHAHSDSVSSIGLRDVPLRQPPITKAEQHARSLLLLIGTRRFCRHVVSSAPGTAIAFFTEVSETRKYHVPIHQFAKNVSTEAVSNKNSLLYHEDDGFSSGALGYWKPFSQALYGDYALVEALGEYNNSPLDIGYVSRRGWDAEQLEAFTRAVLVALKDYLETGGWHQHSFCLTRAFAAIKNCASDLYKIDGQESGALTDDIYARLRVAVRFVEDAVDVVGKIDPLPQPSQLRPRQDGLVLRDIYDEIAGLAYNLIEAASYVRRPAGHSWSVQYNAVWTELFGITSESKAWPIIQFKIRRRIYDEITKFDFLNYRSARVLGLSLNVLGIKPIHSRSEMDRADKALHQALLAWARSELMKRWERNPEVVESGLPENLQINARYRRLVRTFPKFLERKPKVVYFQLD